MDAQFRKDLSSLIKILRKNGVETFKNAEFELKLASLPPKKSRAQTDNKNPETDEVAQEQALFWSSSAASFGQGVA